MRIDLIFLQLAARIIRRARGKLRTRYLSRVLKSMGEGCSICDRVLVMGHENISLGDRVQINEYVILQSCEGATISIGNGSVLSFGVQIITGGLAFGDKGAISNQHIAKSVVIEDSVWIGASAIILPGVTVMHGAVVAAGSVVTRDVDAFALVGGVPAKNIRSPKL